jgi:hypothetical protein
MTSSGRRWAFVAGIFVAFMLPKRVECTYGGDTCGRVGRWAGEVCSDYEIEPWGFSLLEHVFNRDVGFAYATGEDCK